MVLLDNKTTTHAQRHVQKMLFKKFGADVPGSGVSVVERALRGREVLGSTHGRVMSQPL